MIKLIKCGSMRYKATCPECGSVFEYDTEDIENELGISGPAGARINCPKCGHNMMALGLNVEKVACDNSHLENTDAVQQKESKEQKPEDKSAIKSLVPGQWYICTKPFNDTKEGTVFKCKFANVIENPYNGCLIDLSYSPVIVSESFRVFSADDLRTGDVVRFSPKGSSDVFIGILDILQKSVSGMYKVSCECVLAIGKQETFTVEKETYFAPSVTMAESHEIAHHRATMFFNGYKWDDQTKKPVQISLEAGMDIAGHSDSDDEECRFKKDDFIVIGGCPNGIVCKVKDVEDGKYHLVALNGSEFEKTYDMLDGVTELWSSDMLKDGDMVSLIRDGKRFTGPYHDKNKITGVIRLYICASNDMEEDEFFDLDAGGFVVIKDVQMFPATSKDIDTFNELLKEEGYVWNPETKKVDEIKIADFDAGVFVKDSRTEKIFRIQQKCDDVYHVWPVDMKEGRWLCADNVTDIPVSDKQYYDIVSMEEVVKTLSWNAVLSALRFYENNGSDESFKETLDSCYSSVCSAFGMKRVIDNDKDSACKPGDYPTDADSNIYDEIDNYPMFP